MELLDKAIENCNLDMKYLGVQIMRLIDSIVQVG